MPLIESSSSPLVPRLRGLHLFGFDGAPCSQRVSFTLAEKGVARARSVRWGDVSEQACEAPDGRYVFHSVSLIRKDHLTAEYAAIQPNMVVPVLVHDGRVIIESMDIVDYLDRIFPEPALVPADPDAAALMASLIELGKELHVSVRYVSFHWGLGRMGRIGRDGEARIAELERADSPEKLLDFYRGYNSDTIDEGTYLHHLRALESGWGAQDRRLAGDGRQFLTGDTLSRADILWAAKVLRIFECGYPFAQRFPALNRWFERVKARPAFQVGVLGPNLAMHRLFRVKSAVTRLFGGGLGRVAAR